MRTQQDGLVLGRVGAGLNWKNKNLTANAALTLPQSLDPKEVSKRSEGKRGSHVKMMPSPVAEVLFVHRCRDANSFVKGRLHNFLARPRVSVRDDQLTLEKQAPGKGDMGQPH